MIEREIARWDIIRKRSIFKYTITRAIIFGGIIDILFRMFSKSYFFQFKNIMRYIFLGLVVFFINWIINERKYLRYYRGIKDVEDIRLNNKREIVFLSVILILIFSTLTVNYVNKRKELDSIMSVDEVKESVKLNLSEFDYKDYVTIEMKESELLFNSTTPEKVVDNEFNNLRYVTRIRNISKETIQLYFKFHIPPELTNSVIYGDVYFENNIELKPQEAIRMGAGILMKHYDLLGNKEKELFEEFKDILYLELNINDKKAYMKVTSDLDRWTD
ncbi:hypothetical protein [Tissierella praeacuta]|uniref:hypothetical protein n=1 Tax=Tissierella praeacuta TaxID=43131 RepID=UPI003340BC5C